MTGDKQAGLRLDDFAGQAYDKLRYGDTDRQGHVNNAVFATFMETGRVELIFNAEAPLLDAGFSFVLAKLDIDYVAEVLWPGTVEIGTCDAGRTVVGDHAAGRVPEGQVVCLGRDGGGAFRPDDAQVAGVFARPATKA